MLYEKQDDGTLKPVDYPPNIVENLKIYEWLKNRGLTLDEIKFLTSFSLIG